MCIACSLSKALAACQVGSSDSATRGIWRRTAHSAPQLLKIGTTSPPIHRAKLCISVTKSVRFLSIIAKSVHFHVKSRFLTRHFVIFYFVFMYIAGFDLHF